MFCSKCGTQNDDSDAFCYKCGAKLAQSPQNIQEAQQAPVQDPVQAQSFQTAPEEVKASNRKKVGETVSTVILVVLILVVVLASYTNIFSGIGLGGSAKVTFTSDFEQTYNGGGPFVIDSSGTVWSVHSGGYILQRFSNTVPFSTSGSFSSSLAVTVFILSATDWNTVNLTDHGNVPVSDVSSYILNTGSVESGSLNANLAAGTYYIVIFA